MPLLFESRRMSSFLRRSIRSWGRAPCGWSASTAGSTPCCSAAWAERYAAVLLSGMTGRA